MAEAARGTVQSIERGLEILEILADGGEMGISDIASASKLPLPTVHRIIRTLVARGYVHQTANRRYALGVRLIPLARKAGGAIGRMAEPILTKVVDTIEESANLAVLDRQRVMYVAHVPSARSMRMFTEVGEQAFLHSSAVGKVILAALPDAEIVRIVRQAGMPKATPKSLATPEDLLADIELVRRRGYALDEEEHEIGVFCVAVGVPGHDEMAISVSGPLSRMTAGVVADAVPVLQAAASDCATQLAWQN